MPRAAVGYPQPTGDVAPPVNGPILSPVDNQRGYYKAVIRGAMGILPMSPDGRPARPNHQTGKLPCPHS